MLTGHVTDGDRVLLTVHGTWDKGLVATRGNLTRKEVVPIQHALDVCIELADICNST